MPVETWFALWKKTQRRAHGIVASQTREMQGQHMFSVRKNAWTECSTYGNWISKRQDQEAKWWTLITGTLRRSLVSIGLSHWPKIERVISERLSGRSNFAQDDKGKVWPVEVMA